MKSFFELPKLDDEIAYLLERFELEGRRRATPAEAFATALTIESLRAAWVHPAEISEFASMAAKLPLDHVRVVRAPGALHECGFSYMPDEYRALRGTHLITLDDAMLPKGLSLQEAFLHEVAHSHSISAPHEWRFVVYLNLLRMEVGLSPTQDAYDCQDDAYCCDISPIEILRLAAETAAALRKQNSLEIAAGLARSTPAPYAMKELGL
jgi:hypothetical protein